MILFHQHIDYDDNMGLEVSKNAFVVALSERLKMFDIPFRYGMVSGEGMGLIIEGQSWVSGEGYDSAYSKGIDYLPEKEALMNLTLFSRYKEVLPTANKMIDEAIERAIQSLNNDDIPEMVKADCLESKLADAASMGYDIETVYYHETSIDVANKIKQEGFKLVGSGASKTDHVMPHGIFVKPTAAPLELSTSPAQIPVFLKRGKTLHVDTREELDGFFESFPDIKKLSDEYEVHDNACAEHYDNFFKEGFEKVSRRSGGDPEERSVFFAKVDDIMDDWRAGNESRSSTLKRLRTAALKDAGYNTIVVKNDEGSFGRMVTSVINLDPDSVVAVSTDFGLLKKMKIDNASVQTLDLGVSSAVHPNTHPDSTLAKSMLFSGADTEKTQMSSILLRDGEIVGAAGYQIDNDSFVFDIALMPGSDGFAFKQHMVNCLLDDLGMEQRHHDKLTPHIIVNDEGIKKALLRKSFMPSLSDDGELIMKKFPHVDRLMKSMERVRGVDVATVYEKFSEDSGLNDTIKAPYEILNWVHADRTPKNLEYYPFVVDVIEAMPFTPHEKEFLLEQSLNTLENCKQHAPLMEVQAAYRRV